MNNENNSNKKEEEYQGIAWKYFKLHANQRITLFRFYIIFFSLFAIVIGHLISEFHFESIYQEGIVIILSIVFMLITIIFWLLDERNRYFIKNSEEYFESYEKNFTGCNENEKSYNRFLKIINTAALFTREKKDECNYTFRHTPLFRCIYGISALLALVFICFAVYSICHHKDNVYHQIKIFAPEKIKQ